MREREKGGRMGGGGVWAPGACRAGQGWAGLGRATSRIENPRRARTTKRNYIANRNPERNETNTQHQTKKCASA
jgi:hypothetical protein